MGPRVHTWQLRFGRVGSAPQGQRADRDPELTAPGLRGDEHTRQSGHQAPVRLVPDAEERNTGDHVEMTAEGSSGRHVASGYYR